VELAMRCVQLPQPTSRCIRVAALDSLASIGWVTYWARRTLMFSQKPMSLLA
jgi:hypothetical protein